jgi:hypothetical protein
MTVCLGNFQLSRQIDDITTTTSCFRSNVQVSFNKSFSLKYIQIFLKHPIYTSKNLPTEHSKPESNRDLDSERPTYAKIRS